MKDRYQREIDYMRISVTDRCNLRCKYCMPHDIPLLSHEDILTYEEIIRVCSAAAKTGVRHLKVTGGEPLARKGCVDLVYQLKHIPGIEHVTMTTNGVLLKEVLIPLKQAGIDGINISLDTVEENRYEDITGRRKLKDVMDAIRMCLELGIRTKINCVPVKGFYEDSLPYFIELVKKYPIDIRFIEMMPIGYGKNFERVDGMEIMENIERHCPGLVPCNKKRGFGPAHYYSSPDLAGSIGFIEALNHKFCSRCNRIRLTADGMLKTCLYYKKSVDLKHILRSGASDEEIQAVFLEAVLEKPKEHHFAQKDDMEEDIKPEDRKMSQIGG